MRNGIPSNLSVGIAWSHDQARRLQLMACALLLAFYASSASAPAAGGTSGQMVNVVVRGAAGAIATVEASVRQAGGKVTTELGLIDGVAAKVPSDEISTLSH